MSFHKAFDKLLQVIAILDDRNIRVISEKVIYQDPLKIMYHQLITDKGMFIVKFDKFYFETFGKMYLGDSKIKGDSFDAVVIEHVHQGENPTFIFAKDDGIFEIEMSDFMQNAKKRLNRKSRHITYSIAITHFRRMK